MFLLSSDSFNKMWKFVDFVFELVAVDRQLHVSHFIYGTTLVGF